ncbi:MAG TPA: SDR family oxidoreductase, partial [Methylophilaceae bacterium]|nr:SDR family oxidoreductase [Methylophilaceae bacterium]
GSFDWNCLVTACKGYYEPGPFDVRSPLPRPTAVATLMRELSAGRPHSSPVLHGQGWWRRKGRFICPPVTPRHVNPSISVMKDHAEEKTVEPILVIGTNGTITNAFALICAQRNLAYKVLGREELDINNSLSIEHAITKYRPWAIVNAGRTMSLNDAERDPGKCYLENTEGPATLAVTCAIHNIQLLTFSSDMVFDGMQQRPYVESDAVSPLNVYGKSKVVAERKILNTCPSALVIRTSSCFGPWDNYNFVTQALHRLASGSSFTAAEDITFSPTYLPDLVHVSLDLLIDRETGVWHLTNGEAITWANLILRACEAAEIDPSRLEIVSSSKSDLLAALPLYSALQSERGNMLPKLDDALARFLKLYKAAEVADETRRASVS